MVLQTSTENPYGHRPWMTRLYTSFDDFSYLKQPQNTILREPVSLKPQIYKPPEMAGLGAILVSGSGRVLGRTRRRLRGLGAMPSAIPPGYTPMPLPVTATDGFVGFPTPLYPYPRPMPPIIVRGPIDFGPTPFPQPGPMPVAPIVGYPPPPITILPPTIVPPVPTPVASGPGGIVYALPGTTVVPGSPYMPPTPGELPTPGTPVSDSTGAAAVATPPPTTSFSDWFNSQTWIAGINNGYVALGAAAIVWMMGRKGRR